MTFYIDKISFLLTMFIVLAIVGTVSYFILKYKHDDDLSEESEVKNGN